MVATSLIYYMTDFGAVELSKAVVADIRLRKNGQFDLRYKTARKLVSDITEAAKAEYMATGDWDTFPIKFPPSPQP